MTPGNAVNFIRTLSSHTKASRLSVEQRTTIWKALFNEWPFDVDTSTMESIARSDHSFSVAWEESKLGAPKEDSCFSITAQFAVLEVVGGGDYIKKALTVSPVPVIISGNIDSIHGELNEGGQEFSVMIKEVLVKLP